MNGSGPDNGTADEPGLPQPRRQIQRTFEGTWHDRADRDDRLDDLLTRLHQEDTE